MTCRRLRCLIFGHNWLNDLVYRTYGTKLGSPSTGFQLFCTRSEAWVKVSRKAFNRFYDEFAIEDRFNSSGCREEACDCQEGVYYGEDEGFGNY
jgi:hypothetical protein